ncbi:MAG: bifunctional [glutamate--ammonia ligase]-adenylyl-L-tyrosine phosphorylase/[glutamate--ammonia-ligase] adenylyltransferase, partial [Candidatus Binatia bacterium]
GLDDPSATEARLGEIGFRDPAAAARNLRCLRDGPAASRSSARRRAALAELAPALLADIRTSSDPDLALHHMAEFISAVGARTSFLALLAENPETLRLLVGLFGSSRYLSNFFLRHPELLDSLVRADLAMVRKDRAMLDAELESLLDAAPDYESELDALRRFRNEEFLRIGVNDIHGLLDFSEVNEQLSMLAEACVGAALRIASRTVRERFGALPGAFAVMGMGKLGGQELNYNSDLDLIFVYDAPARAEAPGLSVHEAFTKLAQRLMAVLQLTTREGYVYKIDMRLRPSGAAGPLVSSLDAYRRYHETSSALWERQALIRARGVAGDASLIAEVERVNQRFVYGKGLGDAEAAEIARLRMRMERELARESPNRWNLKTGRGGIVDVEFVVQMLQLRHGVDHPSVRERSTERALAALLDAGLLPGAELRALHEGYRFLRRLENSLRIERDQPVEALEHEAAPTVARRMGYTGASADAARELLADFDSARESIRRIYESRFERPSRVDTNPPTG